MYDSVSTSRLELVRATGLSRATVSALVTDLLEAGLVNEDNVPDPAESEGRKGGRPVQPIALTASAAYAVGADIGHQHVRVAICDLRGTSVWEAYRAHSVDRAPQETLDLVAELAMNGISETGVAERVLGMGVDIAAPVHQLDGSLEAMGIMPGWVGVHPGVELADRTGLTTSLANDANAGALGERLYGAGRASRNLVYVRLSAGIGAGVVMNGVPLLGGDGLAGEIGHVVVDPGGRICRCGQRGCLETVASPVAISRLLSDSWNEPVSVADVLTLVASGNPGALRAVQDAAEQIGRVLATLVTILNPELIVVGGELAQLGDLLFTPLQTSVKRHTFAALTDRIRVAGGELGESAEVRGAAGLVLADAPRILAARGLTMPTART
ncbi:ROK family protein [Streptacidiphilus sp. P02-A3a]|uniref:ROK family transcriptional regulator n=1 Tax=Streptacidiphilus sp. P02-A3a TaxID=2704468 RepID=UPI0015FA5208|nr:ROK family protein [Streptacidiphilus sp. P02-A3a]QMU71707.1 ROK family protein [Streptacidiphilus sp. P02-A3a]